MLKIKLKYNVLNRDKKNIIYRENKISYITTYFNERIIIVVIIIIIIVLNKHRQTEKKKV